MITSKGLISVEDYRGLVCGLRCALLRASDYQLYTITSMCFGLQARFPGVVEVYIMTQMRRREPRSTVAALVRA